MAANFTYVPIATTTLASAAASYTFSSIPSTYQDLALVFNGASSSGVQNFQVRFNGDSATNYSDTALTGNGTTATSGRDSTSTVIWIGAITTNQSILKLDVMNYANTTTYKTALARTGSDGYTTANVGLWRSTAAINSITVYISANNFTAGSTFTLYGISGA